MKSKIFLILFMLLVVITQSKAQSLNLKNIHQTYLKGAGTIQKNNQVKGYYFFYQLDKIDKLNNLYQLVITDADLNIISQKEIEGAKSLRIINTSYNNDILAVKFLDKSNPKDFRQIIRFYDNSGNELSRQEYPFNEIVTMGYLRYTSYDYMTEDLFELEDIGFININFTKEAKVTTANYHLLPFNSEYIPWKAYTGDARKEYITYQGANDEICLFSSLSLEDQKQYLFGVDLKTGKKRFQNELTFNGIKLSELINFTPLKGKNENLLFFNLLDDNAKIKKTNSIATGIMKIDNQGKVLTTAEFTWEELLEKFAINDYNKKNNFGNVKIHNVIKTQNGHYFITGERFFKNSSKNNTPGAGLSDYVIAEIVILELNEQLKPVDFKLIDKEYRIVDLPQGSSNWGSFMIAFWIEKYMGFNFYFVQKFEDDEGFTLAYKTSEKKENFINTLTYLDGKYIQDKISLKTESSELRIVPGKPGYFLISEYFKKDKKLDIRLEKYKH